MRREMKGNEKVKRKEEEAPELMVGPSWKPDHQPCLLLNLMGCGVDCSSYKMSC